jgi:hypothetical protein
LSLFLPLPFTPCHYCLHTQHSLTSLLYQPCTLPCKVLPNKDHTHVERKGLLEPDSRAITLGFRVRLLGWKWVVGFIGGANPWGREKVSGLQLSVITRWNRSTCLASWPGRSQEVPELFCKLRNNQAGRNKWS